MRINTGLICPVGRIESLFFKRCSKFIKLHIYSSDMPQLLIVLSPRYGPKSTRDNSVGVFRQQAPQALLIGGIFVSVNHEGYD